MGDWKVFFPAVVTLFFLYGTHNQIIVLLRFEQFLLTLIKMLVKSVTVVFICMSDVADSRFCLKILTASVKSWDLKQEFTFCSELLSHLICIYVYNYLTMI